jgi:hypothetical protein
MKEEIRWERRKRQVWMRKKLANELSDESVGSPSAFDGSPDASPLRAGAGSLDHVTRDQL